MRHTRPDDLGRIADLLTRLRAIGALKERTPGSFYLKGKGFLHFHEHEGALLADISDGAGWRRMPATTPREHAAVLAAVKAAIACTAPRTPPPARSARPRRS